MRLTLDWDSEDDRAANYDDVQGREQLGDNPNRWQLRRSSSGVGYHYVEWDAAGDWETVLDLREQYGDDPKRLRLDKKRANLGSPFLQVLYKSKYMSRWGWQPETGNDAQPVDGTLYLPDEQRIKYDGRLDYQKVARLLAENVFGSVAELARSLDVARTTVSGWVNGKHQPSDGVREKLKRRARHHGVGHYVEGADSSAESMGFELDYFDPDDEQGREQRRTVVEYADAPWDWDIGGEDREYALLNVHTGSFNPNHSDEQLKAIHDDVMNHVLDLLSPSNPETGQELNLDRDTRHPIGREQDSVNWENELLDADEARFCRANFIGKGGGYDAGVNISDAEKYPLFEVILWDGEMDGIEWHLMGVWDGESVRDATITKDSAGWW